MIADTIQVLYVDDESDLLDIGKLFLEESGDFNVTTAMSAIKALRLLEQEKFDAIISDYQMPGMDGIQFLVEVRSHFGPIPFILFTGKGREEVVIQAINNGVDLYLQKGGEPEAQFAELSHKIKQAASRKQAEDALRTSELKYRHLVELAKEGIWAIDDNGNTTYVNPQMAEMLGYTVEEMLGVPLFYFMDDSGKAIAAQNIERHRQGIQEVHEFGFLTKGGTRIITTLSTSPITDEKGAYTGALAVVSDITDRKRVEEELRESEEVFREVFNNANDAIFLHELLPDGLPGHYFRVNDIACKRLGYSREELCTMSPGDIVSPQHSLNIPDIAAKLKSNGYATFEGIHQRKDGSTFPVEINTHIFTLQGRQAGLSIVRDITERKQVEEVLRETTEYLESLFAYANAPIIVWNPDRKITRFNHAFEDLTGRTEEQVTGKSLEILFPPDSCKTSLDLIKKALSGEKWNIVEIPIVNAISGEVKIVLWNSANIMSPDGTSVLATIAQGHDITERKLAEEALNRVNRKLSLLTGITRHDILNQLTVLIGQLELLERKQPDPSFSTYFNKITNAAEGIQAMIQFTREYEQIGVNAPAWQDCRKLVDTAAKDLPLGKVTVKNDLPAGLEVFSDQLIIKVFYNLMDNAVRYGGKITTIRFSALETGDEHIMICEDDGDGIPVNEKKKIFERGFGKNTGLGLALSREILDITGILITETGEPGKGARFEMAVPKEMYRERGTS